MTASWRFWYGYLSYMAEGAWFIEAGFGRLDMGGINSFPDLEAAEDGILTHIEQAVTLRRSPKVVSGAQRYPC